MKKIKLYFWRWMLHHNSQAGKKTAGWNAVKTSLGETYLFPNLTNDLSPYKNKLLSCISSARTLLQNIKAQRKAFEGLAEAARQQWQKDKIHYHPHFVAQGPEPIVKPTA